MAGVTGQQKILTPPRHLILPLRLSGVRVALHSILYLNFDYVLHIVSLTILHYRLKQISTRVLFRTHVHTKTAEWLQKIQMGKRPRISEN
jgi:hypothetical protein